MARLLPNLLGMWVYADDKVPRHNPPALVQLDGRYYINEADVDAFYRWEAAQRPIEWRYQDRTDGMPGCYTRLTA